MIRILASRSDAPNMQFIAKEKERKKKAHLYQEPGQSGHIKFSWLFIPEIS